MNVNGSLTIEIGSVDELARVSNALRVATFPTQTPPMTAERQAALARQLYEGVPADRGLPETQAALSAAIAARDQALRAVEQWRREASKLAARLEAATRRAKGKQ